MGYEVNFDGIEFEADYYLARSVTRAGHKGKPATGGTHVLVKLWIDSEDRDSLSTKARTELLAKALLFTGAAASGEADSKKGLDTLTLKVARNNNDGEHTYTFSRAWLAEFAEFQMTARERASVDVEFRQGDPGDMLSETFFVEPGAEVCSLMMTLSFVAVLDASSDAALS